MVGKWTLGTAAVVGVFAAGLGGAVAQTAPAAAPPVAAAAAVTPAAPLESADALLVRTDKQNNAFKDARFEFKMRIKEPSGQVREIEFTTLQKGNQKRLVRFLAPADVKGMGFLSESADVMYALLPAFGNRVRRLGSHQMNQSFMGSDLSSSDMNAIELATMYTAQAGGKDGESVLLELSLRPGKQAEFPRLKLWVEPKNAVITKIEYMDAAGKKLRTATRSEFKQDGAAHFSPGKMVYTDHRRNNHETELILVSSKLDNGFKDDDFTVRALQQN
ncbi:MAG TPA: outer membrane lipoprotein-sorting protein [Pseudomonadota bacterium]|jgi:outer membrane lipoprotein-sorting protein|nr:outer membrane lipoprotein-sorting protein [Pseudomonadota bacterium]